MIIKFDYCLHNNNNMLFNCFVAVKSFVLLVTLLSLRSFAFQKSALFHSRSFSKSTLRMIAVGDSIPEGIKVDIIIPTAEGTACSMNEAHDLGAALKTSKKAVLFAVPVSLQFNYCIIISSHTNN